MNPALAPPLKFAATPRLVTALLAGAVSAGVALLFVDTPGRILLLALIVVLVGESVRLAVIRPVLSVDASGVRVRRAGGAHTYPWSEVGPVTATTSRRLVTSKSVELDVGDTLVVLPAYRLGADPAEVVAAIEAARPAEA